ncbi:MAG: hypothetical protein HQ472_09635 [Ignavibacteria bacterium]|nr:hypothetical protein [Ignavibacteria bacterium]
MALTVVPAHIEEAIEQSCKAAGVSVISVLVRGQHRQLKLEISVDAVDGITHEHCAHVSRGIDERLENDEWFDRLQAVEISSPGADVPVRFLWQLNKHVGRVVSLTLNNNEVCEGELLEIDDEKIVLRQLKKKTESSIVTLCADVKEAHVVIKF